MATTTTSHHSSGHLGILRKKGHQTAPGPDSWRADELAQLPMAALNQLALIFEIMEERGQAPSPMVAGWLADLAKSEAPASPIAVRPISILSIVWRVYTSARAHALQEWAKEAFAKSQYAYIAGRDYQRALVDLQLLMDSVKDDPGAELHVLSLDASKAFPSTPRAYMWRTLVSRGFPAKVALVVEDAYSKGVLRHRFNGSNVASTSFLMANGIHQGCATSVLGFNAILVEMCEEVLALHPSLKNHGLRGRHQPYLSRSGTSSPGFSHCGGPHAEAGGFTEWSQIPVLVCQGCSAHLGEWCLRSSTTCDKGAWLQPQLHSPGSCWSGSPSSTGLSHSGADFEEASHDRPIPC